MARPNVTAKIDPDLKTFVVSDMHLGDGSTGDPFGQNDELFCAFLRHVRREANVLVIAGDGFDLAQAWSLRRIRSAHGRIFEEIAALSRTMPVYYLQGNHDGTAEDLASMLPLRFATRLMIGDRVRVEHGNALDPRNLPGDRRAFWGARVHALLERTIRSPVRIPMRKHYHWSTRLGHWLFFRYGLYRRGKAKALKWAGREKEARRCLEFLDYWGRSEWGDAHGLLRPAQKMLARARLDLLVCGHSHQAGKIVMPGGTYINTGSWTYGDATYVQYDRGEGKVFDWPAGQEIGDEEYRGVLDPSGEKTFFSWWNAFYRGWFRYDIEAMNRAARGEA